jgi:hypothetical protein
MSVVQLSSLLRSSGLQLTCVLIRDSDSKNKNRSEKDERANHHSDRASVVLSIE